ncbi:MAG: DNA-binding response regulator [Gallionellales bacterium GWA2_60_18]|nr:MAG: DNA-binding response regulator [Gallionellales bacterium GWA2_60_18]
MKFLLVDDHALFRDGLRYILQQLPETSEIMEAGNFPDGLKLAEQHPELDLALLDLNMPGSEGAISIRYFHQRYPHIPVMVVSSEEDRAIMEKVMDYGAMGYVCKNSSAQVVLGAVGLVLSGGLYIPPQVMRHGGTAARNGDGQLDRRRLHTNEYGLTARQMDVLGHLAEGLSNKEIATAMNLAEGTVKIHIAAAYQILRVSNRMEAVRVAEKLGLIGAANE